MKKTIAIMLLAGGVSLASPSLAATLIGSYSFNGNFDSSTAGGQTLGVIDPTGQSGFGTDTVFGTTRTVWNFNGNTNPTTGQSGLTLNPVGVTSNSYSIALTFKFNEKQNAWRRIYDVTGRTSDDGFYVNTSNQLAIYPTSGSAVAFNSGAYRNVVLTVDGNQVSAYADGGLSFSTTTPSLALGAFPMTFFADNITGGGTGEWSSGSIAALRVYDGVLNAAEITALNATPFVPAPTDAVPEPTTWAMMLVGFGAIAFAMRRGKRNQAVRYNFA